MKHCNTCNTTKDLSMFYKCKAKKDGYQSNCKKCHNNSTKRWRNNNLEKYQNYEKNRVITDTRRIQKKEYNERRRKNISDSYVRELICKKSSMLKAEDINSQYIIDIWRENLKIKRKLRGGD